MFQTGTPPTNRIRTAALDQALTLRYASERSRQLTVLLLVAAAILLMSVLAKGTSNVFPYGWWHVDLP